MTDDERDFVRQMFEERIPFNRLLGLQIVSLEPQKPIISFENRAELVGNYTRGILHGGVISATLDTVGGLAAYLGVLERDSLERDRVERNGLKSDSEDRLETRKQKLSRIGTIDLRIDYLRSGRGDQFLASAHILRTGSRVAVIRMELHNDEDLLIAVGTGTYIVG